ncbi:unnamed protein product [Polarella glacialis]|uniref:DUF202 domain-containing protein n=1 Tax=Polarella glacialis TaxID=89957 RepID=A0A813DXX5_POLGL|nr:unnamed protein product [Polarella glacialis]CAE8727688.1 unnamed protein product [Polarella glacialis]
MADAPADCRTIYVRIDAIGQEATPFALYPGMLREDFRLALAEAAGLTPSCGFCLRSEDGSLRQVPISAALPDGLRLQLIPTPENLQGERVVQAAAAELDKTQRQRFAGEVSKALVQETEVMRRMSHMTTYLSNDRTILAWTRTALAILRTTLSVMSLNSLVPHWRELRVVVLSMFALATLLFMIVGFERFRRLRKSLDTCTVDLDMIRVDAVSALDTFSPLWKWFHPAGVFDVMVLLGIAVIAVLVAVLGHTFKSAGG